MTTERSSTEGQAPGKGTRRKHSIQYKRRVVLESLKPGAAAREVAHRHGLHESLLGVWRRQHSQGRLQDAQSASTEVTLLPVQVPLEAESPAHPAQAALAPRAAALGTIHIEFSHGHRLSVRGDVDANTLSVMLRELSRT
jgi:transposase